MAEAAAPRSATTRLANLALQGGGSHGAFTWGVLDALLEDGRVEFEGASGTSAGAMNAVVLAHALARAHADGLRGPDQRAAARSALARFWDGVGLMGTFMAGVPLPAAQAFGAWFGQWFSPYQTNPLGLNPLRTLLQREVDFELLAHQRQMKVFVTATNIRTGRGEVFSGQQLSCAAVMASACLPTLFQAVEIDGEHYWDGGYSGNPALFPLYAPDLPRDIVIVNINPMLRDAIPKSPAAIQDRVNEISFNTALLSELRAINFVKRLHDEGRLQGKVMKNVLMHMILDDTLMNDLSARTKILPDPGLLERMFEAGRIAADAFLDQHADDINHRDSVDFASLFPRVASGG